MPSGSSAHIYREIRPFSSVIQYNMCFTQTTHQNPEVFHAKDELPIAKWGERLLQLSRVVRKFYIIFTHINETKYKYVEKYCTKV